jgi:membrane protein DedA with SNARE-associated domain
MDFNFIELIENSSYTLYLSYLVFFIAAAVEGPITTVSGAFLSSLGGFNVFIIYILSVLGDIVSDIVLYYLGYFGGQPIISKAEKLLKIKKSFVTQLNERFKKNGGKIVFYVKLSTGLCWITFLAAGAAKMSFKKFIFFSFLGGLLWSGLLVMLGYFFGYAAEQIENYIKYAGWLVFGTLILIIFIFNATKKLKLK